MKKILICSLICCSLFLTGCGSSNKEVKEKINEEELSSKFFDNQTIDTLEVQNFNITVDDNGSYISFNLKNTSNDTVNVEYIKISLYDTNNINYIQKNLSSMFLRGQHHKLLLYHL